MKTILHLITGLHVGGAQWMLYKLLSHSDSSRFRYVVVSMLDDGILGPKIMALGIPVYSLCMGRGQPNPMTIWKLMRILRQERPYILQTWLYHADLLGLICGKLVGIPRIAWNVRSSFLDIRASSKRSALILKMLSVLSPFPNVVVVNSRAGHQYHRAIGYHPARWEVIPNGFDLTTFRPDLKGRMRLREECGLNVHSVLIGMIASYDPIKDHDNFLSAAKLLMEDGLATAFLLAGRDLDQRNAALMEAIAAKGLSQSVHLLGERDDIPAITASLDIAVSSSRGEGFSNAIGEAMTCGVPCVVTDVGDSRWIVGDAGIVVPPHKPGALARALRSLIDMGVEGRSNMGINARRRIEENFNITAVAVRYERLYEELALD